MDISPLKNVLFIAGLSLTRLVTCFIILPFMGARMLPGYIRNTVLLTLVFIIYPFIAPSLPNELSMPMTFLIILKEVFIGLLLGFMVSIVFWTAEIIGFLIDNQRGATMGMVFDPLYGHQTSPLGVMLLQTATVLFFASGGFLIFLEGLFESYQFWPVFEVFPKLEGSFALFFLRKLDELMRSAFLLACPILIAVFLTEFCLGLMNRFVPQLNVFFLSMPIKSGVASFLIIVYLAVLIYFFRGSFHGLKGLIKSLKVLLG
jgi:type III secretion protein T